MSNKIYLKNETGLPTYGGYSNYTGIGINFKNLGLLTAVKITENSSGGFFQASSSVKTPIEKLSLTSRTRYIFDKPHNGNLKQNITERIALKYSQNFGKVGFYEIAGANANYSVSDGEFKSLSPVSLTGIDYKISKNTKIYGEFEISKGFDLKNNSWNDGVSTAIYLGLNIDI